MLVRLLYLFLCCVYCNHYCSYFQFSGTKITRCPFSSPPSSVRGAFSFLAFGQGDAVCALRFSIQPVGLSIPPPPYISTFESSKMDALFHRSNQPHNLAVQRVKRGLAARILAELATSRKNRLSSLFQSAVLGSYHFLVSVAAFRILGRSFHIAH